MAHGLRRSAFNQSSYDFWTNRYQVVNVKDYGAVGDGVHDDTAAIQAALDATPYGGTCFLPPTQDGYYTTGTLSVPDGVTFAGEQAKPPIGQFNGGKAGAPYGSCLLVTAGHGSSSGTAFLTIGRDAAVRDMVVYYPNQTATNPPVSYPYALSAGGDGMAVINVLLVNPYQGLEIVGHQHPFVDALYMQPLYRGVYCDQIYDTPRLLNIHCWQFWQAWDSTSNLATWLLANAIAYTFGRVDDLFATNLFAYGYNTGISLIATASGTTYGNITNLDIDGSETCISISGLSASGVKFANTNLTGLYGSAPVCVDITNTGGGAVSFSNTTFTGASSLEHAINIASGVGAMTLYISNGLFVEWGQKSSGAAIVVASGNPNILGSNCNFAQTTLDQLDLSGLTQADTNVKKIDGIFGGGIRVDNPHNVLYELTDATNSYRWGYGSSPSLPTGTGSGNAVMNPSNRNALLYQSGAAGTHILDALGNDQALASGTQQTVLIPPGGKVYYATTVPTAWTWFFL